MEEHSDKQNLYDVATEMQDYNEEDDTFKDSGFNIGQKTGGGQNPTSHNNVRQSLVLLLLGVVILLTVANLVFQIATIYQASKPTAACETSTSTTEGLTQDGNACSYNCTRDIQLLENINVILNTSLSLSEMQLTQIQNTTDILEENLDTTQDASSRLLGVIGSLANVEDNTINTDGTVNDILLKVEMLLRLQNQSQATEYKSCQDIKDAQPDSPSGYYHIHSQIVYCEMGELCGNEGGWTRLAYLDMSDSTVSCPDGFALIESGGVRACGRPASANGGCLSVKFPSNGISYSKVCGRVHGYQYGSPDAADTRFISVADHNNIDTYYVDGVSITRGFPRQHIWTMMAGLQDSFYSDASCPCNDPPGSTQEVQSFVGDDYFCESGNSNPGWGLTLYTDDPLWDGEGCGSQEGNCCAASSLPWFYKTFNATTDYLELRMCCDQRTWDEDVPVGYYEMYIK